MRISEFQVLNKSLQELGLSPEGLVNLSSGSRQQVITEKLWALVAVAKSLGIGPGTLRGMIKGEDGDP